MRVAYANSFSCNRQISIDPVLVGKRTGHTQRTSASHGGQRLHLKPVLVENQCAMQLAKSVWNVLKRQRPILEVDAPFHVGIRQRSVRFYLERSGPARREIGIDGFGQLQIDRAARCKIELARALERQASLRAQIRVFASYMQRVEINARILKRGMHSALALQMNTRQGHRELLQPGLAAQLLRFRKRSFDIHCAGQRRLSANTLDVCHFEQCADIELRETDFGLGGKIPAQCGLPVQVNLRPSQPGSCIVDCGAVGGVTGKHKCAKRFSVQGQPIQRCVRFQMRVLDRTRANHGKPQLARRIHVAAQRFDLRNVDSGALGVYLEVARTEIVAARRRDRPSHVVHRHSGEFHHIAGKISLCAETRNRLAQYGSAIQLHPARAIQRPHRTVNLNLRVKQSGNWQLLVCNREQIVDADLRGAQVEMERGVEVECLNGRLAGCGIECSIQIAGDVFPNVLAFYNHGNHLRL